MSCYVLGKLDALIGTLDLLRRQCTLRKHDDSCCMVIGGLFQIIVYANWHNTVQAMIILPLYSKGTPQMEYS